MFKYNIENHCTGMFKVYVCSPKLEIYLNISSDLCYLVVLSISIVVTNKHGLYMSNVLLVTSMMRLIAMFPILHSSLSSYAMHSAIESIITSGSIPDQQLPPVAQQPKKIVLLIYEYYIMNIFYYHVLLLFSPFNECTKCF